MSDSKLSMGEQIASVWHLGGLTWQELAQRVWYGINKDDLINRAYELAYNFLLAVFPLLLCLLALIGVFASEGGKLRVDLFFYLQEVLPPVAFRVVISTLDQITQNTGGGKLTFGLLFALFSGTCGMTQLISTLNAAYDVSEDRSWLKVHLLSLELTVAMFLLIIASLLLALAGGHVIGYTGRELGLNSTVLLMDKILQWVLAPACVVLAFATIYYFAPDVRDRYWYWITPGSVIGVLLWASASGALRGYLHFFNTYSAIYGSLGAVMILMLWFYVMGLALLVGGEINSTIEHAASEHGHPEAKPRGSKTATGPDGSRRRF
jgi:membrane protein